MAQREQTGMNVKTSKRTMKRVRSTLFFLATLNIFACTDVLSAPCELPSHLKVPGKTFIINEKVSCGTNMRFQASGWKQPNK